MAGVKKVLVSIVRFILYIFFGLIGMVLMVGGLSMLFGSPTTPEKVAVEPVEGTLARNPYFWVYGNGETKSVTLYLNEYPYQSFVIDGSALEATRYQMMNTYLSPGDTMFLLVSAEDYKEHIEPDTATEYTAPVAVYGARSTNQIYLTVENYSKKVTADSPWTGVFFILFGGLFLGIPLSAIYSGMKQRKKNEDNGGATTTT